MKKVPLLARAHADIDLSAWRFGDGMGAETGGDKFWPHVCGCELSFWPWCMLLQRKLNAK